MTSKNDEMILVFDKEIFEKAGLIESLLKVPVLPPSSKEDYKEMLSLLNEMWEYGGYVKRRGDVENDKSYLQPIVYMVIKKGNKYFAYTRLNQGGEERLHGKTSIGIGGHSNDVEYAWNFEHLMAVNASRELQEEVYVLGERGNEINNHYELTKNMTIAGLGYSNETDVDAVHVALFSILTIPEDWDIKVKETDTLKGEFKSLEDIKELDLENWSKMVLNIL